MIKNEHYESYYKLIDNAVSKDRSKKSGYYESHHIIPKSMGGSNDTDNLVLLTPEEHYLCHSLLPDFTDGEDYYKMLTAWNFMSGNGTRSAKGVNHTDVIGIDKYSELKRKMSDSMSGDRNPNFGGKLWSGESHPMWGVKGKDNPRFGMKHSQKTKDLMSSQRKGIPQTQSHKDANADFSGENNPMFGKTHTIESKNLMSKNHSGGTKKGHKYKLMKCPHCLKEGGGGMMTFHHFNNCKLNDMFWEEW